MNELFPGLEIGRATRDAYGDALRDLGAAHPEIVVLDADLAKSTRSWSFGSEFPDRFFNVGIQEANMVGMAGGLAMAGKVPFISSFACFVILKGFDQLRMAVAYPNLNVKICGSHQGISVGEDGASQQSVEDIALACSLPNMYVAVPADEHEMRAVVRAAFAHDGPVFIRSGRPRAPLIYDDEPDFAFGRASRIRDGDDVTIVATGIMTAAAVVAHDRLAEEGIGVRVLNVASIKPLDTEAVAKAARETGAIVTAEEHLVHGGLGAVVAQSVARTAPVPMEFVGLEDSYAESGPPAALMKKYGLTPDALVDAVRRVLDRKGVGAGEPG
jgi:transketolase